MALTQEEIRIKSGLDYSKVTAGLTDVRRQVYKLASDVPKQLGNILKANVFGAASTLISELLPSIKDFWDSYYNVGPEADQRLQEAGENLRSLRQKIDQSRSELSKTMRDQQFDEADTTGRLAILEGEYDLTKRTTDAAREKLKFIKEHVHTTEQLGEAQLAYNTAFNAQLKAQGALKELQSKLTPEQLKAEYDRKLNATRKGVTQDRIDIGTYNMLEQSGELTDEQRQSRAAALGRIGRVVQARGIGKLGDMAGKLPSLPLFGDIKSIMLEAQRQAMLNTIQEVRIVDIK